MRNCFHSFDFILYTESAAGGWESSKGEICYYFRLHSKSSFIACNATLESNINLHSNKRKHIEKSPWFVTYIVYKYILRPTCVVQNVHLFQEKGKFLLDLRNDYFLTLHYESKIVKFVTPFYSIM